MRRALRDGLRAADLAHPDQDRAVARVVRGPPGRAPAALVPVRQHDRRLRHARDGDYGISAAEIVAFAATEKRYRTGVALLPNPITEKLQVPTVQEIADIHASARSAAAKGAEFESFIDFTAIEELRDLLAEQGRRFFRNALEGLPRFGVDVRDPLQMLAIRRLGAQRLEQLFHPGARDTTRPAESSPSVRRSSPAAQQSSSPTRSPGSGRAASPTRSAAGG